MKNYLTLTAAAAVTCAFAGQSSATYCYPQSDDCVVYAHAYGSDSYQNDSFWTINFKRGCDTGYIQSITIDLQDGTDADAFFDLSGSGSYGPVIGSLDGLNAGDVSFDPNTGDTSALTVNFAAGSFGVGDSIKFGADTDDLGSNKGGSVGWADVGFSITFENGETYSTTFNKITHKWSKAKIKVEDCCGTGVPTPSAAAMGVILLAGIGARRRRTS